MRRNCRCIGTGTVTVVWSSRRCMTRWLPLWRTSSNPLATRMAHASAPERTLNLGNRHVDVRDENHFRQASVDFGPVSRFEKQFDRFPQVLARLLDGIALTGGVDLGARRDKSVPLTLDDRGGHPELGIWISVVTLHPARRIFVGSADTSGPPRART